MRQNVQPCIIVSSLFCFLCLSLTDHLQCGFIGSGRNFEIGEGKTSGSGGQSPPVGSRGIAPTGGLGTIPQKLKNFHGSTHTQNRFTALWILSGTTHGHQWSLICFLYLLWSMTFSLFNLRAWQSFSTISLQEVDQRKLGERLWKNIVRCMDWTGRMPWIIVDERSR